IAGLTAFKLGLDVIPDASIAQARTMAFVTIVFGELFRAYSARSERKFLFQMNPFSNKFLNYSVFLSVGLVLLLVYVPFLANIFSIEGLTGVELLITIGLGFVPMLFGELTKIVQKQV
ncbi:MAG: cation-translocating P-type ATPase C-terminal domain-containing protein, partial [Candidatus Izemoplasmatales bacterium]